jgi:hypothetical protein
MVGVWILTKGIVLVFKECSAKPAEKYACSRQTRSH